LRYGLILTICVRVLAVCNDKIAPDPHDVEVLRKYLDESPQGDADELACAVIGKAVRRRTQARTAMKPL